MNILKNIKGFTLIEAIITMLILTIGILAINKMQISSIKGNATANKLTIASTTASNAYELLLSIPYDNPALDPIGNPHDETEITGLQLPSGVSAISWNVTEWTNTDNLDNDGDGEEDETDENNIKMVTLNIIYQNRSAKILTINFLKSEIF